MQFFSGALQQVSFDLKTAHLKTTLLITRYCIFFQNNKEISRNELLAYANSVPLEG